MRVQQLVGVALGMGPPLFFPRDGLECDLQGNRAASLQHCLFPPAYFSLREYKMLGVLCSKDTCALNVRV